MGHSTFGRGAGIGTHRLRKALGVVCLVAVVGTQLGSFLAILCLVAAAAAPSTFALLRAAAAAPAPLPQHSVRSHGILRPSSASVLPLGRQFRERHPPDVPVALSSATAGPAGYTASSSPCAVAAASEGASAAASQQVPLKSDLWSWLLRARPLLLIAALVLQKCATDALTWYTRAGGGAVYSGATVALLSEIFKYPVLALAVAMFESPSAVLPTFQTAATDAPLALAWVGAAYAAQNLLYFVCLDHISAAGYQVLSQSKLIFTALLMSVLLRKRFSGQQIIALVLLLGGAAATQLAEASGAVSLGGGGNALFGCGLTVLSAFLSALPNVFYERLLKKSEGKNEWASNVQLTTWILVWVLVARAFTAGHSLTLPTSLGEFLQPLAISVDGFTPTVWCITFLKTLNCIIIPACLKYADNILYGYAKPVSIVLTCAATAAMTSTLPPPLMLAGITTVLVSMALYGKG